MREKEATQMNGGGWSEWDEDCELNIEMVKSRAVAQSYQNSRARESYLIKQERKKPVVESQKDARKGVEGTLPFGRIKTRKKGGGGLTERSKAQTGTSITVRHSEKDLFIGILLSRFVVREKKKIPFLSLPIPHSKQDFFFGPLACLRPGFALLIMLVIVGVGASR
jgi:hypothetical protein